MDTERESPPKTEAVEFPIATVLVVEMGLLVAGTRTSLNLVGE